MDILYRKLKSMGPGATNLCAKLKAQDPVDFSNLWGEWEKQRRIIGLARSVITDYAPGPTIRTHSTTQSVRKNRPATVTSEERRRRDGTREYAPVVRTREAARQAAIPARYVESRTRGNAA